MSETNPCRMGHIPESATSPSSPPIYQTTAFDIADLEVLADLHSGAASGHIYTRDSNPNHSALAESIAQLEHTEAGAVFASGMGAIAAVAMTLAGCGDHVIVARSLYGVTLKLMTRLQQQFAVDLTYVDACHPHAVAEAIRPTTKFCMVETISNPLLEVIDLAAIASVLGEIPLVVDSTFTTPELIRPIEQGAAIVVHSASKYLNGHGDVMLGVAAGSAAHMRAVRATSSVFGQNANPFESWLTQRGLRTLPLRVRQVCETTTRLAEFLNQHPGISKVYHPSLVTHGTHATAARLYSSGPDGAIRTGGIVSIVLNGGGKAAVSNFMQLATSIPFSPTLADSRTTISHPATTSHAFMSKQQRAELGIVDEMIRISVGLESFDVLRDELDAVLNQMD